MILRHQLLDMYKKGVEVEGKDSDYEFKTDDAKPHVIILMDQILNMGK